MFRRNLGLQLLALYLIFIIPVIVGAWVIGSTTSAQLEHDAQDNDLLIARAIALETGAFIDNSLTTVEQLARMPHVQNLEIDQLAQLFAPIALARSEVNLVYVLDAQGIMRYHYPEGPGSTVGNDFSTRQYFQIARTARAPLVSVGRISPTTGRPVVTAVMPLRDMQGNFLGVVATNLELSKLSLPLREITADRAFERRVSILDASGQIIADSDPTKLLIDARIEFPAEVNAVLRGETKSQLSLDNTNREWLRSYVPIPTGNWGVVVQRPTELAFAVPRAFRVELIVAVGLFLANVLAFWMILSRRVIAPMESLARFSTAIGKRAVVPADRARLAPYATRGDQVGGLMRAVTQMECDIERRIEEQAILLETSTAVISSLDLNHVLDTILEQVHHLLDLEMSSIITWDEAGNQRHSLTVRGLSEDFSNRLRALSDAERVMLPAVRAIREKQLVLVSDTETESSLPASLRDLARAEGFRALLAMPLLTAHAEPAALVVYRRAPHVFGREEISLVTAFAHQAAMALENAALYARVDEKLREREERYRQLVEMSPDAIVVHQAGKVVFVNPAALRLMGAQNAGELLNKSALGFVHPDFRPVASQRIQHSLATGTPVPVEEEKFLRLDGTAIDVEVVSQPITYDGEPAMQVIVRDITARKRAESDLRRLRMAVDDSNEAIFMTDREGIVMFINPGFTRLYGYNADEVIGKVTPRILKSGKMTAENYQRFWQTLLSKQVVKGELINKTKGGQYITIEGSANPIVDEHGNIVGFLGIQRDITERKRIEEKLKELSIRDALTGLYNRGFFEEEMARLEHGRQFPISIVMADLNNLKETNDRQGHAAGDALLQRAAQVFVAAFRADDIIARIGGDEFAVILPSTSAALVQQSLRRIRRVLNEHNNRHDGVPVSIAFGVSTAEKGIPLAHALKEADARMYKEKRGS